MLSSAYAPEKEARTWAESLGCGPGSLVFVAGDPWGLASLALQNRGIQAVALLPGRASLPWVAPGLPRWVPEESSLETFLADLFETTGPEAVQWTVWPAFERLAPSVAQDWSHRFRDHFRTVQGSWLTQNYFGRKYWKNSLRNLLTWNRPARLVPGDRPVVIAASGPSLNDGFEVLARHRARYDLWALPSSFSTLVQRGLAPDVGVATDGGYYAKEHLHCLGPTEVPVLAALSSAPDPVLSQRPCQFFSQGMPVEQALFQSLGHPFAEVPSQGTVAVTALRLALEATSGPVFIAGLDLAFRDLRGHTSPHTVDRTLESRQGRFFPTEGLWAQRLFEQATEVHDGVRTSPALLTYAGWFRTRARFPRPVYRIAPSGLHWGSMTELTWDEAAARIHQAPGGQPQGWSLTPGLSPARRRDSVDRALRALQLRVASCAEDDPWLVNLARTAAPQALAEDFRARRRGLASDRARAAVGPFLDQLRDEVL